MSLRAIRRPIVYTIDLLAAVPSVVFGLWALRVLETPLANVYSSVSDALSGFPILGSLTANPNPSGASFMTAGIVVAIMITPIITAITREVYATCPPAQKEAALALGATRWETVWHVVLPYARSGIMGSVILALARALGETMAVTMVIGNRPEIAASLFAPAYSMAAVIANELAEAAGDAHLSALVAIGLVLFGVTVVVNGVARLMIYKVEGGK